MDARYYRAITLALLIVGTPAHAGGICTDKWTGSVDAPASETVLWSESITGGTIPLHDAVRLRVSGEATGAWNVPGSALVYLNGQEVGVLCLYGDERGYSDITITRTGTTTGRAEGMLVLDYTAPIPVGHSDVTGLAWGSAQTLAVKGYSGSGMTLTLEAICVER